MSLTLRIVIIIASLVMAIFVLRKIRKSQFIIGDTLYWLCFCIVLIIMGVFPSIVTWIARVVGVQSAANLVFASIIFFLILKIFLLSVKISNLETKLVSFAEKYAIDSSKKE